MYLPGPSRSARRGLRTPRIPPPLLTSELLKDVQLGSFRPFRGFEGSNVPVPPDVAADLPVTLVSVCPSVSDGSNWAAPLRRPMTAGPRAPERASAGEAIFSCDWGAEL